MLVFIHIKVNSQSDAFRLFEAINNRGVLLSALDIIKNAMLAALERETAGSIDEAFEMWSSMTEQLDRTHLFMKAIYATSTMLFR
jgi:uncharacterized protein with ParB-like and HNH nuclease domain